MQLRLRPRARGEVLKVTSVIGEKATMTVILTDYRGRSPSLKRCFEAPWPLAAMPFSLPRILAFQRKCHPGTAASNQAIIHARLALRYPWSLSLVPTPPSTRKRSPLPLEFRSHPWLRLGQIHSRTGLTSRRYSPQTVNSCDRELHLRLARINARSVSF
ncbi:hypothetical protein Q31a_13930 [Aureliella helgolandensis]|uniref:Uncharacterized protein n=1 Tax=Aureliella helgolandensis TaxID=2527968 RepID=A0A518G3D0_9BACT|nr:hypothetical protein Q31a_13930 [Aureliella helgolandensis]